jgi:hypothetical protein
MGHPTGRLWHLKSGPLIYLKPDGRVPFARAHHPGKPRIHDIKEMFAQMKDHT